jgi:hypothetical protein
MQTLSSNKAYNSAVQLLKPEERKMNTKLGEKPFSFIMAPDSKKNRFLKRINAFSNAEEMNDIDEVEEEAVEQEEGGDI